VTASPTLVRLEYQNSKGDWTLAHAGIALLAPGRYVERLADKGKIGRATVLDPDTLAPTGKVYEDERWDLL
jgi:hypothetical protein